MNFPNEVLRRAANVALVAFDVDGVLTDGKIYYNDNGQETKAFHVQDGSAIKLLQQNGVEVAIITGRCSAMVERRATELGIEHLYQDSENKRLAVDTIMTTLKIEIDAVAYVGDDLGDIDLFDQVGLAISVPNGHPAAIARAHYVTEVNGGGGVAREVCQLILSGKGLWRYD
ncbi:MAG: HAD-IIIA family hydrolase [Gammaproteobacteria bacterium]|nr:MAG: HAD-IIIA family hydrolase [Gammaproteobacteria bacterium]TDJ40967.1 MAG: HAD-IIIA family hydrolase [Gammaproteobacteria bacterium]